MKYLGTLRNFLGIEVTCSIKRFPLSQRKYLTNFLEEFDMMGSNLLILIDPAVKFDTNIGD